MNIAIEVTEAIKAHAIAEYPKESCGIIANGQYQPFENIADDPEQDFAMKPEVMLTPGIEAIVHSHPEGPDFPSRSDMAGQIASNMKWGIIPVYEGGVTGEPWFWGPGIEIPPLIERDFRHGPTGTDGRGDCYSLIRDWYTLNRGVTLPDFPRDDGWWERAGQNLYEENFAAAGFVVLQGEPQTGDVFLMQINAPVINHAGIFLADEELILHHLSGRLSRCEPLGRWRKHIVKWLRYHNEHDRH